MKGLTHSPARRPSLCGAVLALAVILLALSVGACSRSTPTSTPQATVPPYPTSQDYITVLVPTDPPHLDVQQDVSEVLASLGPGLAYSRLLRLKTGPDVEQPSMELECELCTGWEMPDPVTYIFHLRQDVRWQNIEPVNGRSLVAQDLVYSYERQRTAGWPNAGLLQSVDRMEAADDYTLRMTLKYPDADILMALADGHSKIVAHEAVEVHGDLRQGPVIGSGPWRWVATERGEGTLLKRNAGYFEDGLPGLEEIQFRVVRDDETRYAVFATQTADVYQVSPGFLGRVTREVTAAQQVESVTGGAGTVLAMNTTKGPFDQVDTRRAVLKALDPWEYLETVWEGHGYVSLGIPLVRPDWLLSDRELQDYLADPDGARTLLKQSGVTAPLAFELTLADYGGAHLEYGRRVQEALRQVGFEPIARLVNPREYSSETWPQRDFGMLLGPLSPSSRPNEYLLSILHSGGRWDLAGHTDATLDELIEDQAVETDIARRGELVRQVQRRILEQAYLLVTVSETSVWTYWPHVEGLYPNAALSEYFFWARVSRAG